MATSRTDDLSPVDHEAMTRAIELCCQRGAAKAEQIDDMIADDWRQAAVFSAYSCQNHYLHLAPWQDPPCEIHDLDAALRLPFGDPRGRREAAEILKKLLANNLSRYEPDPRNALDQVEARKVLR